VEVPKRTVGKKEAGLAGDVSDKAHSTSSSTSITVLLAGRGGDEAQVYPVDKCKKGGKESGVKAFQLYKNK
jgi:hypothetical protein